MTENNMTWHGTTILSVRKSGEVVVAGDGQVDIQTKEIQLPTRDHSKTYAPKNSLHHFL